MHKVRLSDLSSAPTANINTWKIAEMEDWCKKHTTGKWQRDFDIFCFENKIDAFMFMQTWL
jgi:hypothetical protein